MKPSWQWPQGWRSPLPLLLGREEWHVWWAGCAGPFTSQREREKRREDPPEQLETHTRSLACRRVPKGRAVTCPNPLNCTDPEGSKQPLL